MNLQAVLARIQADISYSARRECTNGNNVEGTMALNVGGWERLVMAMHYENVYPSDRFCHESELWINRLPREHTNACKEGYIP